MYTILIEAEELAVVQETEQPLVTVDCRFDLAHPEAGFEAYRAGHIPGAVYAHLGNDLSGAPHTDHGRHPLPSPEAMRALFRRLGIGSETQVVAYDDANGAIAARLWWMLRYMGHEATAVLNGGLSQWLAAGYPLQDGVEENPPGDFSGEARADWLVLADEVPEAGLLVDSRALERYRGDVEPIDARAGHIPGALNLPYEANWDTDQRFLPATQVRQRLESLFGTVSPHEVTFYCGSGVTACNNLLAMAYAGLGDGRLYAGSWSDWISDAARPIALGPDDQPDGR